MTRLAVTADVHCDDFGSRIDPGSGLNARWLDSLQILRWVANDAAERGADAMIVAGDLTESRHPAPWRVAQIGEALEAFGGPVILARGNHDGERDGRSIVDVLAAGRDWHGFTKPGVVTVGQRAGVGVAVAVLPYLDQHRLRALPEYSTLAPAEAFRILGDAFVDIARGLYVQAKAMPDAESTVLVVHQGLSGGLMSDKQQAFLGDQSLVVDTRALGAIGFDAIVAGHFHKHQVLSTDPLIAYAGSPHRADFGETEPKGYLIVEVVPGTRGAWEFVETPARRFVTLGWHEEDVDVVGAVVRVLDAPPEADVAEIRRTLEVAGAWDVQEIRRAKVAAPVIEGGLSEGLTPQQALAEYFAGEDDQEALVERGRGILEAVS